MLSDVGPTFRLKFNWKRFIALFRIHSLAILCSELQKLVFVSKIG